MVHGTGNPAVDIGSGKKLIDQAGYVLAGSNSGDWACEDVVEHQRRDAELSEAPAQRFFHHTVNTAEGKHGAALQVKNRPAISIAAGPPSTPVPVFASA